MRAQLHAGVDSDGEEGVDEGEPPGALALRRDVADVGVDAEEEAHQPPGAVLQRLRRNGEELLILIDRDLGGHTHMTSTKISEFWTVCIYRIKFLQSQLLRLIFGVGPPPPPTADVICVCSLAVVREARHFVRGWIQPPIKGLSDLPLSPYLLACLL